MAQDFPCIPIVAGTVRYVGPRGPVAGVTVLFHDDSGTFIDRGQTDAAGETRSLLPLVERPGLVTVIVPEQDLSDGAAPTLLSVETFPWEFDLINGPLFAPEPTLSLAVTLPGTVEGAASYFVDAGAVETTVTDPSQPVVLTLPTDRRGSPPAVLAMALDEAGVPLAWSLVYEPAADVTLEAWRDSFVDVAVDVANNPEGTTGFGYLAFIADGREFDLRQRVELPAPTEPAPPAPEPLVQRVPDEVTNVHLVTGYLRTASMRGVHVTPELAVDLAEQVLAPLERAPTILDRGTPRPSVEWDESDQARPSHRTRITLRYTSEARAESWVLPAQGEASGVRVPELPADLTDRAPVDLEGAEVDVDLLSGENPVLFTLYAGGNAEASPPARSRFESPIEPEVSVSSTTFSLSPTPAGPR